jgi:hypothetical protein
MRRKILTVEDTFKIKGRGLILAGGFDFNSSIGLRLGDEIIVVQSDGAELKLLVKEIPFICRTGSPPKHFSFSVGEVEKELVPIGSEVFIEVL